jgi:hypothetical protein
MLRGPVGPESDFCNGKLGVVVASFLQQNTLKDVGRE